MAPLAGANRLNATPTTILRILRTGIVVCLHRCCDLLLAPLATAKHHSGETNLQRALPVMSCQADAPRAVCQARESTPAHRIGQKEKGASERSGALLSAVAKDCNKQVASRRARTLRPTTISLSPPQAHTTDKYAV